MSAYAGWALAGVAVVVGWFAYGWRGIALAITVVVFWLLLQFSRSLRVLRRAAQSPVGHVNSAVMLNARLARGMRLPEIIRLTGSLGTRVSDEPETYAWRDTGGDQVEVVLVEARCDRWQLKRAAPAS